MEDILYFILMAAVMVGGVISSANKKKKEREAAARKAAQNASGENPEPERKFVRKSLGEVLEEFANQQQAHEPQAAEEQEEDYAFEMASGEEAERATERLRAMTYVSAENTPRRIAAPEPVVMLEEQRPDADSPGALTDILGGGFDLRRAVVETEILKPKFEQY